MIIEENDIFFNLLKREKKYRKVKKELFSWNNSYSNKELFYTKNKNIKYKLLNFMSEELGNPLIVPILDFNRYKPEFSLFDDKTKLFKNDLESKINIDLNIFESEPIPNYIDENNYSFICRYVKPYCHIKGKIIQYPRDKFFHFIHIKYEHQEDEINFDKEKKIFYGSYFDFDKKKNIFLYKNNAFRYKIYFYKKFLFLRYWFRIIL
jgi:hypothetical protein